jgi:hypothetical protein
MKLINALRRRRYFAPFLVLIFVAAVASLSWSSWAFKDGQKEKDFLARSENKRALHAQIRDGLGKEVKFADKFSTDEEVRESVESVAGFIQQRSGLEVTENVKERLVGLENEHLRGNSPAISSADLIDALTATAVERLSNVSDSEVDQAAAALSQSDGEIILRGNGRGHTTSSEFVKQAKVMRDMSRQDDSVLRDAIHKELESAVTERMKTYSRALPKQFGEAETKGVTPLQAVLITYSVVSDDLLAGSKDTLKKRVERTSRTLKNLGLVQPDSKPGKAYGKNGTIFATPVDLVLDETTMTKLLDRVRERSKQ